MVALSKVELVVLVAAVLEHLLVEAQYLDKEMLVVLAIIILLLVRAEAEKVVLVTALAAAQVVLVVLEQVLLALGQVQHQLV
jgi:hypothetical protein